MLWHLQNILRGLMGGKKRAKAGKPTVWWLLSLLQHDCSDCLVKPVGNFLSSDSGPQGGRTPGCLSPTGPSDRKTGRWIFGIFRNVGEQLSRHKSTNDRHKNYESSCSPAAGSQWHWCTVGQQTWWRRPSCAVTGIPWALTSRSCPWTLENWSPSGR